MITEAERAERDAAKAGRVAVRGTQKQARLQRKADRSALRMLTAAERRAARAGTRVRQQFYTPGGVPAGAPTIEVAVPDGAVVTSTPTVNGVITPDVVVAAGGVPCVAAATVNGGVGWVGLQWVTADGAAGAITWVGGEGRVVVTATAPVGVVGARMLLAGTDPTPGVGVEPETALVLTDLTAHIEDI